MTNPNLETWPHGDGTFRRSEVSAIIGKGDALWARASTEILRWGVKTASGFGVDSTAPVAPGDRVEVTARVGGLKIIEPVEVLVVVDEPSRVGFSYGTLPGHPVNGEEAFIIDRRGDDIHLTVRSLTRAASQQPWRALFPLLLIAQLIVRRRYLRALRQ